jgi:signal transduction histidine kinase
MIRTMFSKILFIVIFVLIISFIITGLLMNTGLTRMVADQKAQQLQITSQKVIVALETFLKTDQVRNAILFNSYLQTLADNTDSIIWILREDGTIILYSSIPEYLDDKLTTSEEGWPRLPDKDQYESLDDRKYESGDFYGLFKDTGVEWLTISQHFSLKQLPPHNSEAEGIILIHSQIPSIYKIKSAILMIFVVSGTIGAAVALLLVAILSKRAAKPLVQMKLAARRVASGEFTERISVKGKDEIAELSESFNNMVVALENLEQMRRDFISNVSHELRTPITTIKGFIEGILDGVIPEERQEGYLSIARDEVKRMQHLVNDLLDIAKMQAGEVSLNKSDFDMNELVRRSVIGLQQMFIEKDLEFKADFETERMFVNADREAIQRVLINLLHNAVKFTPEGGVITVKTSVEKDKAIICVEDTGKGISKDELPYIFERFYKADKSRSVDRTGVGLGLAIARNIIVSHDETIKVESQEGRGALFIFTLRNVQKLESY